jgi:hypothetical protein
MVPDLCQKRQVTWIQLSAYTFNLLSFPILLCILPAGQCHSCVDVHLQLLFSFCRSLGVFWNSTPMASSRTVPSSPHFHPHGLCLWYHDGGRVTTAIEQCPSSPLDCKLPEVEGLVYHTCLLSSRTRTFPDI